MPKLEWNRPQDQVFEAGLDRGVIYVEDGPAVAWNGLTSVDDDGDSDTREFFIDGIQYLSVVNARNWKGKLSAYTYPEEFSELIGIDAIGDGFYADSQMPGRFDLSYRTLVGSGAEGTQHYKIHLIYKVMAALSGFTNETLTNDAVDPIEFEFDLSATPIVIPNKRPSAHLIIDTRKVDPADVATLEGILYGTSSTNPSMPTIEQLLDILQYSDGVVVVYNGDGTWTATGSASDVFLTDDKGHFQINNVNATYLSEDVYEFFGIDALPAFVVLEDTDGVPYYVFSEGFSNIEIDSDGVPYFVEDGSGASIKEDTDGQPYYYFD